MQRLFSENLEHKRHALQYVNCSIPEHLVFDHILPKLPVKSLVRFTSVSKTWQSTISSSNFVKSHLKSSSNSPKFIIFNKESKEVHDRLSFSFSYDEQNRHVKDLVKLDFAYDLSCFIVVGSCNGLVCLCRNDFDSFWIWNPAIQQYAEVTLAFSCVSYARKISAAGFCYVASSDDYKIIAFVSYYDKLNHIEVHSLKTQKPKVVHTFSNAKEFELRGVCSSVEVDDIMYWAYWQPPKKSMSDIVGFDLVGSVVVDDIMYWPPTKSTSDIVGFDLVREELIMKPPMEWMSDFSDITLFRIKGCLSLCCRRDMDDVNRQVWTLKRHEDWTSWEKLFDIDLILKGNKLLKSFSDSGMCLVEDLESKTLKLFDPSEETPEQSKWEFNSDNYRWQEGETLGYVESLVWPTFGINEQCSNSSTM